MPPAKRLRHQLSGDDRSPFSSPGGENEGGGGGESVAPWTRSFFRRSFLTPWTKMYEPTSTKAPSTVPTAAPAAETGSSCLLEEARGTGVGIDVGMDDGAGDGFWVGLNEGAGDGAGVVGRGVGAGDGINVGLGEGLEVGRTVGA